MQMCAGPAHKGFGATIRDTGTVRVGGTPTFGWEEAEEEAPSLLSLTEQPALQPVREEVGSFNVILHLLACPLIFELP